MVLGKALLEKRLISLVTTGLSGVGVGPLYKHHLTWRHLGHLLLGLVLATSSEQNLTAVLQCLIPYKTKFRTVSQRPSSLISHRGSHSYLDLQPKTNLRGLAILHLSPQRGTTLSLVTRKQGFSLMHNFKLRIYLQGTMSRCADTKLAVDE